MVQSVLHTLYLENTRMHSFQRRLSDNNGGKGFKLEDLDKMKAATDMKQHYTVYNECAVVGVEVARRPKYQLIASIIYLLNFHFRKLDRKTELFDDLERQLKADWDPTSRANAELLYD
jgi:hypothetical protein